MFSFVQLMFTDVNVRRLISPTPRVSDVIPTPLQANIDAALYLAALYYNIQSLSARIDYL